MEITITLENPEHRVQLFGTADTHLRMIRQLCDVQVTARDGRVRLKGQKNAVNRAAGLLDAMQTYLQRTGHIGKEHIVDLLQKQTSHADTGGSANPINVYIHGHAIAPRSDGQQTYLRTIEKQDMVFCTGPAGTGKTYLAVAMAVSMLKQGKIRRIILARPAVEAGEKLGFLPGDMQAKVNPYLRPLFDALGDMMDYNQIKQFMTNDIIEVVPLAFMRGRTLNDAVVILDEAQNTTVSQMLMFLTRLGHDSKMIITGDDSQSDLEISKKSGLIDAIKRLKGIKGIGFTRLGKKDIVRHKLVQTIVKAYEKENSENNL